MIPAESSDCFCAKLLHLFFFWPRLHVATMLTRSEPTGLFSFLLQLLHLSNMEMLMACWQYYHFVFVDISSSSSLTVCLTPVLIYTVHFRCMLTPPPHLFPVKLEIWTQKQISLCTIFRLPLGSLALVFKQFLQLYNEV